MINIKNDMDVEDRGGEDENKTHAFIFPARRRSIYKRMSGLN